MMGDDCHPRNPDGRCSWQLFAQSGVLAPVGVVFLWVLGAKSFWKRTLDAGIVLCVVTVTEVW